MCEDGIKQQVLRKFIKETLFDILTIWLLVEYVLGIWDLSQMFGVWWSQFWLVRNKSHNTRSQRGHTIAYSWIMLKSGALSTANA